MTIIREITEVWLDGKIYHRVTKSPGVTHWSRITAFEGSEIPTPEESIDLERLYRDPETATRPIEGIGPGGF